MELDKAYKTLLKSIETERTEQGKGTLCVQFAKAHDLTFIGFGPLDGQPLFHSSEAQAPTSPATAPTGLTLENTPYLKDMTKAELKQLLDAAGIKYGARDSNEKLIGLLTV